MTSTAQTPPFTGQAEGEPTLPPIFPTLPVELGGYRLTQLLGSHADSDILLARQNHIERRVTLEVLRPVEGDDGSRASRFLNIARTRAAVRLPHVAPVLESATAPEGYCYICQALPAGRALSSMAVDGDRLTVPQTCTLIRQAGELYEACTRNGLAAAPLTADRIFVTQMGTFNFLSPVQGDSPTEEDGPRQLQGLAEAIRLVQPVNVPGQGRISTLLSWMQEGYEGEALEWPAASGTAELIAEQLKPDARLHLNQPQRYDQSRERRAGKRRRRRSLRRCLFALASLFTILAMSALGIILAPDTVPSVPALREGCVHIRTEDKVVRVAARPVSIAEYRSFLDAYPSLDASRRGSLTQNIPPAESDPTPDDWEAQFTAAEQGSEWQGRRLSPDSPVTNVSYWQALMYARHQRGTLPTAAQLAAARAEAGLPGVEEWSQNEILPNPPYARARLILPAAAGDSPVPENNPATHTPNRGFRICP